jgi:starch synthase
MDIVCEIFDEIFKMDIQMIILGTGDEKYHKLLGEMAIKYKNCLSLHLKFDNPLAHLIYAGSDIFLMPSLYEPCGLGQMISFRYGTVPLVRETGGLADTVLDFITDKEKGNGFSFKKYAGAALLAKIQDAHDIFKTETSSWRTIIERGMSQNFSWRNSTAKYLELYRRLIV